MNKPKSKIYLVQVLKDYGLPLLLSIAWALYVVYQNADGSFWEVFAKNFIPAFFVLNWLSIRINRTKRSAEKKMKERVVGEKIEELKAKMDRIEKLLIENNSIKKKEE